jgi:hypothetical protein
MSPKAAGGPEELTDQEAPRLPFARFPAFWSRN